MIKFCISVKILFFLFELPCFGISCIYPIAYDDNSKNLYLLYQINIHTLKLIEYNLDMQNGHEAILSLYNTALIKLLPDNSGYSFLDKGKIRIKYFNKRTPKTIYLTEPIIDIGSINWLDKNSFYFTGIKNKNFGIYKYDINNKQLNCIKEKNNSDCLYPQIINDQLYFIERTKSENVNYYKIFQNDKVILDLKNQDAAFLTMIKSRLGFYLNHPKVVDTTNEYIEFDYCKICQTGSQWSNEKLFSFSIPIKYIFGTSQERLFESILPLLPKVFEEEIYFVNSSANSNLNIYSYCLSTKTTKSIAISDLKNFCPLKIDSKLYYGKILQDERSAQFDISTIKADYINLN